jgi:hypothetical protein
LGLQALPPSYSPVLCLHAGNLPLVGFQDVLAVLLSGRPYAGKLSRKDPWLIDSFLKVLKRIHPTAQVDASIVLEYYRNAGFDTWMFAGSDASLSPVESLLSQHHIIKPNSRSLRRTAHFSATMLTDTNDIILSDLCEAMFRYGGRGCRSVAIVYSAKTLREIQNELSTMAQQWFSKNRYLEKPNQVVLYRHAYNRAVGITSILAGSHVIQEGTPSPDYPEVIYWQPLSDAHTVRNNYGPALQEVYNSATVNTTTLSLAQRPPIDWKPDGTDTLKWLLTILF